MGTFHFKSDLRTSNHQAIVQPRLYDCLMVTQITLGCSCGDAIAGGFHVPCRVAAAEGLANCQSRCPRAESTVIRVGTRDHSESESFARPAVTSARLRPRAGPGH